MAEEEQKHKSSFATERLMREGETEKRYKGKNLYIKKEREMKTEGYVQNIKITIIT